VLDGRFEFGQWSGRMSAMVINSADSLQRALGDLRDMFTQHKFLRVNIKTGKDRSLDFNAISHVWYEQITRELREDDALGWKCFCKLNFAVPIMRAEDAEFREFYDASIKSALSYEQKLAAMKYLPVTSLMTNPQFKKYCDEMQAHFLTLGVRLEFPVNPNDARRAA
jgi:hypothetical protein